MKIRELISDLMIYNPEAEIIWAIGPGADAELLSIYSDNDSPKDKVVYIDVGRDGPENDSRLF